MTTVLWLLGALGLLGAFDTIYFHEIRGQLPARLPGLSPELKLHAGRSFIYVACSARCPGSPGAGRGRSRSACC
jgi:hypothetical protein